MWTNFEHQVWRNLTSFDFDKKNVTYILALSGGLDSMVLANIFLKLRPQSRVIWAHFHHGEGVNSAYRDQAVQFIQEQFSQIKNLFPRAELRFGKSDRVLHSEDDYRQARRAFLLSLQTEYNESVLVTGHHADDVLETRLIKMIRGGGAESLKNFKIWNGLWFRPLLNFSKQELQDFAESQKTLCWLDDPSNADSEFLRNWLRQDWLPALEKRHPGAVYNLSQSLERLLEAAKPIESLSENFKVTQENSVYRIQFERMWFVSLSTKDQLRTLAEALRQGKNRDFSLGHLEEILKRLDKNQKELTFAIARTNWFINAQHIVVQFEV